MQIKGDKQLPELAEPLQHMSNKSDDFEKGEGRNKQFKRGS